VKHLEWGVDGHCDGVIVPPGGDPARPADRIALEVKSINEAGFQGKIADLPVQLSDFRINNYAWSEAFDAQIQATMQAAQQVKKAEQDLKLTEQQSQKRVKEAEATRQALILTAEGEKAAASLRADAKALEGEGIAKYNAAVAKNMDMEVKLKQLEIEKIRADKWNGVQPQNNYFVPPVFSAGAK
jgi:regulator of protease activity HflC (stomatin/prohibitin superfamily)